MTWHGYLVEKIHDWSAICAYLCNNVQPGDIITGNAYTQGRMCRCFRQTMGVSIAPPGSYTRVERDGR